MPNLMVALQAAEHRWHPLFNAHSLADGHYLTAAK